MTKVGVRGQFEEMGFNDSLIYSYINYGVLLWASPGSTLSRQIKRKTLTIICHTLQPVSIASICFRNENAQI